MNFDLINDISDDNVSQIQAKRSKRPKRNSHSRPKNRPEILMVNQRKAAKDNAKKRRKTLSNSFVARETRSSLNKQRGPHNDAQRNHARSCLEA